MKKRLYGSFIAGIFVAVLCAVALTLLPVSQSVAATTLTPALEFNFENNSLAYDSVAQAENATVTSGATPTAVARGTGSAAKFDGKGGLTVTNAPDLTGSFTLTFDFYQESMPTQDYTMTATTLPFVRCK